MTRGRARAAQARGILGYVRGRWIVTAFRIDPSEAGPSFATRAVRMSFAAERPFFPYSEPRHGGARPAGGPFRVSVVAPFRVRALEGERGWPARLGYAGRPGARLARALRGVVPSGALTSRAYVTVFDEPRSVRGADDLFLQRDPDRSAVASTIRARVLAGR